MWDSITITNRGVNLLSGMINGSKLTFTRAAIGSGTVPDDELAAQTDISEPINAPALIAGKREAESGNGIVVRLQIRNDGVTEGTRMRQVGLFAQTDHHEEILFGILQNEIGEEIPAYADFSQLLLEIDITVAIGRTNNISVEISSNVYPSREEFEALRNQVAAVSENVDFGIGFKIISVCDRDPGKPDYFGGDQGGGGDDGGETVSEVVLKAGNYTGTADITLIMSDGVKYDAENMSRRAESAPNGYVIIEEV